MIHRHTYCHWLRYAFVTAALWGWPATCLADTWMVISTTGSMPNRVVTYTNANSRRDIADPSAKAAEIMKNHNPKTLDARIRPLRNIEMKVVQVFENPKAPAILRMTTVFDCGNAKRYKISDAEAVARNKLRHRSSRPAWQAVPADGWINRAQFVACDEDVWLEPAKEDWRYMQAHPTNRQTDKLKLPAYGIVLASDWEPYAGPEIVKFTWDTVFSDGTFVPFNDSRTAAEEQTYQVQLAEEKAAREEAKKLAPQLDSLIGGLEGTIKGMDEESKFQEEIAKNFSKRSRSLYHTLRGFTEEQLVEVRGAPSSVSTHGNLRLVVYQSIADNRQEVAILDGKGHAVGREVVGEVLSCEVTFKLRVGGNQPQYRVVDYEIKQDITPQGRAAPCH